MPSGQHFSSGAVRGAVEVVVASIRILEPSGPHAPVFVKAEPVKGGLAPGGIGVGIVDGGPAVFIESSGIIQEGPASLCVEPPGAVDHIGGKTGDFGAARGLGMVRDSGAIGASGTAGGFRTAGASFLLFAVSVLITGILGAVVLVG